MMPKYECMVLRLVLLILGISLLISSLKDTSSLARNKGLDMSTRIMTEFMYGGELLYKNANKALDFLKDLSDKT